MLPITVALDFYAVSDQGKVRKENQDAWLALPKFGLFVVADGMGGCQGGAVASREIVRGFEELAQQELPLEEIIAQINQHIYKMSCRDPHLAGMGSTLCCLQIQGEEEAVCAHVGDSRIYRLRKRELERLTEDHSLFSELVSRGEVDEDAVKDFPQRHVLTRAVGIERRVRPTLASLSLEKEDLFLLCTDGLTNFVSDEQIEQVLSQAGSLEESGNRLVTLANERGGKDNITVILVRIS